MSPYRTPGRTVRRARLPKPAPIPEPVGPPDPPLALSPFFALEIIERVARKHNVPPRDITGESRLREHCMARWEAAYLMSKCGMTSGQIGKRLNRDHSSILHGIARWREILAKRAANG